MPGKRLHEFTEAEYELMKRRGALLELFPEATGNYGEDVKRSKERESNLQKNNSGAFGR